MGALFPDLLAGATQSLPVTRAAAGTTRLALVGDGEVDVEPEPPELREGLHGWMHRMTLVDVLQMYHHAAQSLVIQIRGDGGIDGWLALRHGELIHAESGLRVGVPALVALLAVNRGQVTTGQLQPLTPTITRPFDHVLLDALRMLDEIRGDRTTELPLCTDGWFDEVTDQVTVQLPAVGAPAAPEGRDELGALDAPEVPSARDAPGVPGVRGPRESPDASDARDSPVGRAAAPRALRPSGFDAEVLGAWLAEHAPGASLWWVEAASAIAEVTIERLAGEPGEPPAALGWAHELADAVDPAWMRVELTAGTTAIALIRANGATLAFARAVTGEAMQRRFHVETTQLVRWLCDQTRAG